MKTMINIKQKILEQSSDNSLKNVKFVKTFYEHKEDAKTLKKKYRRILQIIHKKLKRSF